MFSQALAHLNSYHRRPAIQRRGDRLFHTDRSLLLYYQNRLAGHDLPEKLEAVCDLGKAVAGMADGLCGAG